MRNSLNYVNSTALELRLQTDQIIERIDSFLRGSTTLTVQDAEGKITNKEIKTGTKLLNKVGVAHIVNYVSSIINSAVVQGNYSEDWYRFNLEKTHKNLAFIIAVNTPTWEIIPTARHSIMSFIMEIVKPFLSRLIDNKERESYAQTIKSSENVTHNQQGGLFTGIGIK